MPGPQNVAMVGASAAVCALSYVVLVHWLHQDYNLKNLTLVGVFGVATLGLALLLGITHQFSLAHAFFFAQGAYGYGILAGPDHGWAPMAAAITVVVASAAVAYVIGPVLLRLEGFYFAVATLGLALIGENLLFVLRDHTGGDDGLPAPNMELLGYEFDTPLRRYVLVAAVLGLGFTCARNLSRSAFGRSARAIAVDELMAGSNGIPVVRVKTRMFVIATVYAAVGGVLYAAVSGYIFPAISGVSTTLEFVVAIIVGGMGGLLGPVLAMGLIRWLPVLFESIEGHIDLLYGIALIVVLMAPAGRSTRSHLVERLAAWRPAARRTAAGDESASVEVATR